MINSKDLIRSLNRPAPDNSSRARQYRFDRNERTTLFTEEEFKNMMSQLTPYDFVAYGELEPFYYKTAKWLQVERDNILLTSGSDMGIRSIFETYINKGDRVLISLPNYAMFSVYNKMFGGVEQVQWYEDDLTMNVNNLLDNMKADIKLLVISNPGHTGTIISETDLIRIVEKAQSLNMLVLIDEAYHHFYQGTMIGFINLYKNLIISRTFSKAFGLASLRVGVLLACKEIIDELYRVKLVHEITGVAAKIGSFMLDNLHIVDNYVHEVNKGKDVLYNRLPTLGIQVFDSDSNFVFFQLPKDVSVAVLLEYLGEIEIYIKGPFTNKPFTGQLRITVGDTMQMNLFCDELEKFLKMNSLLTLKSCENE
ncbi:MAG: histidinol-phosphate aminotransferase family protein [Bacteroidales bacterium]|nr:histidinol-phosphate aminotransferase family protein [Bacteroidales bacterium]